MEDPPNPIAKIKIKSKRTVNAVHCFCVEEEEKKNKCTYISLHMHRETQQGYSGNSRASWGVWRWELGGGGQRWQIFLYFTNFEPGKYITNSKK